MNASYRALHSFIIITTLAPQGSVAADLRAPAILYLGCTLPIIGGIGVSYVAKRKEESTNLITGITFITFTLASCIFAHKQLVAR